MARDRGTGRTGAFLIHPDGTPVTFARDLAGRSPHHDSNAATGSHPHRIYAAATAGGLICPTCGTYLTGRGATPLKGTLTSTPCTELPHRHQHLVLLVLRRRHARHPSHEST